MALYNRMIDLRQNLGSIAPNLGDRRFKIVSIEREDDFSTLVLTPKLMVLLVDGNSSKKWMSDTVELFGNELEVSGVSRNYPAVLLRHSTWVVDGIRHECVVLDESLGTTYKALIRPYAGR
jgi:hypothetical protein